MSCVSMLFFNMYTPMFVCAFHRKHRVLLVVFALLCKLDHTIPIVLQFAFIYLTIYFYDKFILIHRSNFLFLFVWYSVNQIDHI